MSLTEAEAVSRIRCSIIRLPSSCSSRPRAASLHAAARYRANRVRMGLVAGPTIGVSASLPIVEMTPPPLLLACPSTCVARVVEASAIPIAMSAKLSAGPMGRGALCADLEDAASRGRVANRLTSSS